MKRENLCNHQWKAINQNSIVGGGDLKKCVKCGCTNEEKFNPASDEFHCGEKVYNEKRDQIGLVVSAFGTLVQVRYYEDDGLSYEIETTSMQDLISDAEREFNENEAAGMRASVDDQTAWDGGFAKNN